jgi:hypothetical protein
MHLVHECRPPPHSKQASPQVVHLSIGSMLSPLMPASPGTSRFSSGHSRVLVLMRGAVTSTWVTSWPFHRLVALRTEERFLSGHAYA